MLLVDLNNYLKFSFFVKHLKNKTTVTGGQIVGYFLKYVHNESQCTYIDGSRGVDS